MKKNYEIKCKIDAGKRKDLFINLKRLSYKHTTEKQIDIYYKVIEGRLKLRIINDLEGSLILYNREEKSGKRISKYIISKTKDFRELDFILRKQFRILATVNKRREVFIKNNVRVHLDKVKELGEFLEIEIIYGGKMNLNIAKQQMKELIELFDIDETKFIKTSYSDLLINRK